MRDLSTAMQDYLKGIYHLQHHGSVATNDLARHLDVSAASVTSMIRKLHDLQLVRHEAYRGVELTPAGRKVALELIRHHRLIETYLAEALGYAWHEVHAEAEKLEHHISEEFEDRIAAILGHPQYDPHGDPIPSKDGRLPQVSSTRLSEVPAGSTVRIRRVSDYDAAMLQTLTKNGMALGSKLVVTKTDKRGNIRLKVSDMHNCSMPQALADNVFVEYCDPP
jgi:DtxR family Mn-dependent transcriptional regulator